MKMKKAALLLLALLIAVLLGGARDGALRVPILMYHGVADEAWGQPELFVRVEDMERQLQYLAEGGYTTLTFDELPRAAEVQKPILLTFDDGYRDIYENLFPLLKKYNLKATLFLITDSVGHGDNFLTADMLREMAASGLLSIQSHSRTHPDLTALSPEELKQELEGSASDIEALTGLKPIALAYPSGHHNAAVREAAAETYRYGVTSAKGVYAVGSDPLRIRRLAVPRDMTLTQFAAMIR
ncbi:MAG: polysaccharide deacetylase family protein [Firmicutes bacterium]|nr:polysaccharide deacetylase family protein [Bacillota bacterium]